MRFLIAIVLFSFMTSQASAASDASGGHFGIKTGAIDVDLSGFDVDTPIGFVFGRANGGLGMDFEFNYAKVTLSRFSYYPSYNTQKTSETFSSIALYGVFRSEGEVYFKAKGGLLGEKVGSESDAGISVGAGFGVRSKKMIFETEYTVLDADANFISIGVYFNLN